MSKEQQEEFEREVAGIINRMSLERFSNTPDFILAKHLCWALLDYNATSRALAAHRSVNAQ